MYVGMAGGSRSKCGHTLEKAAPGPGWAIGGDHLVRARARVRVRVGVRVRVR